MVHNCKYPHSFTFDPGVDLWVKVKSQIMYFLVTVSLPKPMDVAISYIAVHRSHVIEGTGQHFV